MERTKLNELLVAGLAAVEGTSDLSAHVWSECTNALRLRRDGVLVLSQVVADGVAAIVHFQQYQPELTSSERDELLLCVREAVHETSAG